MKKLFLIILFLLLFVSCEKNNSINNDYEPIKMEDLISTVQYEEENNDIENIDDKFDVLIIGISNRELKSALNKGYKFVSIVQGYTFISKSIYENKHIPPKIILIKEY